MGSRRIMVAIARKPHGILSIVADMSVAAISQKAITNLGSTGIRPTAPVFAGDSLYGESQMLSKRELVSRPS